MAMSETQSESARTFDNFHIGKSQWFHEVVGLQNWGIDPIRDVFHVTNEDVVEIFKEKKQYKGYCYHRCKSESLRARIEELYRPIFQEQELSKDGFICESFARAAVSETLLFTSVNWALLAEKKFEKKRKAMSDTHDIILYRENENQRTYRKVVLDKMGEDDASLEEEIAFQSQLLRDAEEKVREAQGACNGSGPDARNKIIQEEVKKIRVKIAQHEVDRDYATAVLEVLKADPGAQDALADYIDMQTYCEAIIMTFKGQLQTIGAMEHEEGFEVREALKKASDIAQKMIVTVNLRNQNRRSMQKLSEQSCRLVTLRPSCILQEGCPNSMDLDGYIGDCSLCGQPFPLCDVVLASCGCHYHPWCILSQVWIAKNCANKRCDMEFAPGWLRSMGLSYVQEAWTTTLVTSKEDRDVHCGRNLNSDIGGITPKRTRYNRDSKGAETSNWMAKK